MPPCIAYLNQSSRRFPHITTLRRLHFMNEPTILTANFWWYFFLFAVLSLVWCYAVRIRVGDFYSHPPRVLQYILLKKRGEGGGLNLGILSARFGGLREKIVAGTTRRKWGTVTRRLQAMLTPPPHY